jgi:hypothetical protein
MEVNSTRKMRPGKGIIFRTKILSVLCPPYNDEIKEPWRQTPISLTGEKSIEILR